MEADRERREGAEPLWTIREVAAYLHVHEKTVARWLRSGRLPCVRIGLGALSCRWAEVERFRAIGNGNL